MSPLLDGTDNVIFVKDFFLHIFSPVGIGIMYVPHTYLYAAFRRDKHVRITGRLQPSCADCNAA